MAAMAAASTQAGPAAASWTLPGIAITAVPKRIAQVVSRRGDRVARSGAERAR